MPLSKDRKIFYVCQHYDENEHYEIFFWLCGCDFYARLCSNNASLFTEHEFLIAPRLNERVIKYFFYLHNK